MSEVLLAGAAPTLPARCLEHQLRGLLAEGRRACILQSSLVAPTAGF